MSEFAAYLKNEEKSRATIEKYLRDAAYFADFASGRSVSKELTIEYKAALKNSYAVTSANSMIASLNFLLRFIGSSGPLFIIRSGRPMNRCNVWRKMKGLCRRADVKPEKVFSHNLHHLFARTFYGIERDIAELADLLGHGSINTTRIYIITAGAEHRRKLDGMRLII